MKVRSAAFAAASLCLFLALPGTAAVSPSQHASIANDSTTPDRASVSVHERAQRPQSTGCAGDLDMPLDIRIAIDESKIGLNQPNEVEIELLAQAPLRQVLVRVEAGGAARLDQEEPLAYEFMGKGEVRTHVMSVRFIQSGLSRITVEVSAVIDGSDFPFTKRVVLNTLLEDDRVLTGLEVPRHLQVRAVREKQQDGILTQAQADAEVERLTRLDGQMDERPFVPIVQTAEERTLVEKLRLEPTEPIASPPGGRGGVSLRVMGQVQWLDENGTIHPVYGMTVQVRDDETVGSELVRVMATDANGQYDTGVFSHDDGFGAGNPDIFVRFRTENTTIDVEDGCFLCGTYESDSAIRDEFPGGTIVQNFTCANTGTGPACSVLTGLTWIAVYTSNLNGGNFLGKIRADWPGDSGSSNYNCTPACRINVQPGDKWDWDVLHHEYGHYVMDEFDFEDNPGGTHFIDACHTIARGDKDDGIKLAWAEGWPTFFGTAGQRMLNMASLNVPRVGDVLYSETEEAVFSYSLENNTGDLFPTGGTTGRGEDSELAVQRLFWDLFDNNVDSRDHVNVSDQTLFNLVAGGDPHSLSAAWAPIRATLTNEQNLAFGAVTTDHLIGPRCTSPAGNTEVTLSNATFSWDGNVGCDPSFAGNSFELVFYRPSDYFEALKVTGLTATTYTLSSSEYQTVRGYGPELIWAVEARNTASPTTGPYLGDNRSVFMYATPSNNDCANARAIGDGHVIGTTQAATADGSDSCIVSSRPDVWFSYAASCTGFVTMSTCGSDVPTSVSIHDACPGTFNNQIACADGFSCGTAEARANVVAGQSYLVRAAAATTSPGNFEINTICTPQADSCDDALPVAIGGSAVGSTAGSVVDSAPTCGDVDVTAPGVWFTVIGNGNELTASLCGPGTNYDSQISVYCGGCGNPWCRAQNDDTCGLQSEATWCSTPGAVHHILVHGFGSNVGEFELSVTDSGQYCGPFYLSCVPANNTCGTATELSQGEYIGDNTSSTTAGTATCRDSNSDVWYRFEPVCNGFITVSTCGATGSLADTVLTVYDGCNGREIACNDDFAGCGLRSQVTVPVYADEPIWIRVASYGTTVEQGTFPLKITGSGMVAPVAVPPPGLYVAEGDGSLEDCLTWLPQPGASALPICPLTAPGVSALAYAYPLGILYGINDQPDVDTMVLIDPETAVATPIGTLGFGAVKGLTYHPDLHVLLGSDVVSGLLIRVNPFSGAGSAIGAIGFSDVRALAYDVQHDVLWGSDIATDQLIRIDPTTGAGTAVGSFGPNLDRVEGLAFDYVTGTLYGVNHLANGDGELLTIDTQTGAATRISAYGQQGPTALAFIPGLADAKVGEPYLQSIPIAGGCPRYSFGGTFGLPEGLDLSADGVVLGTPTQNGEYNISFDVDDSNLSSPPIHASVPLRVRPGNDDCEGTYTVGGGTTPFSSLLATTDGPDEPGICDFSGDFSFNSDIWFCHTATCTGNLSVNTCDSAYDTKLAVYDGCSCPVSSPPLACNDDSCGGTGLQSSVSTSVTAGNDYLIRLAGYAGTTGTGNLEISCTECVQDGDCNDNNACTVDSCSGGRCSHTFLLCDDADLCTIDGCEAATGCTHDAVACDDEDACTSEVCNPATGLCEVTPLNCNDNDDCTVDDCLTASGCTYALIDCDADGVCDLDDNCPTLPNGNQANADGDAFGDACDGPFDEDHDGDVDILDYVGFEACLEGPMSIPSPACLDAHDGVPSQSVDLEDFWLFQRLIEQDLPNPCAPPL